MVAGKRIYFPNLNGIRFIAAFLVVIHHIEMTKSFFGLENFWQNDFVRIVGKLGVILFFVLSGFLITYLLIQEKKISSTISIKKFYLRRILRIWPLYYAVVALSFFILPKFSFFDIEALSPNLDKDFYNTLPLYIFFLPNVASSVFKPVAYAFHVWSVGVEEQFYFVWPILMKRFKNTTHLLVSIIVGYLSLKFMLLILTKFISSNFISGAYTVIASFPIDCMAIGGFFALMYFNNHRWLAVICSKKTQIFTYLLLIGFMAKGVYVPYIHNEFYSVLFGILVLNLATNKNSILKIENGIFRYLGKLSYGIYMLHSIAITIALKILIYLDLNQTLLQYGLTLIITILLSSASYHLLESPFLKLKTRFTIVKSGEPAS